MAAGRSIASLPGVGSRVDRHDRGDLSSSAPRKRRRAFERIYARHHQELYRYCFSILRSREDAEDALQATMAAALRSLPGEKREIALRPWLFRVAHNESISLLRTRRPAAELLEESGPASPSAEAAHGERDRLRQLVDDLRSLPERQSAAIVMRELSGLSYEEIGAALSTSEAAARQAVYEGRVALRTREEGREMECESVRQALSDCDGRGRRAKKLNAHLDGCDGCRGFAASIERRRADLAMLCPPIPALAATGILGGLLGGSHGSAAAAAGLAGSGAGAAGSGGLGAIGGGLAGSAAVKGASLAAAVVIAAGAADIGGAIDLTHPFGGGSDARRDSDTGPAGGTESSPVVTSEVAKGIGVAGHGGSSAAAIHGASTSAHGSFPGHGSGRSAEAPGIRGDTPGQAGTAPGRSGETPANPADTPGQADGTPGASGEAPGAATSANGSANGGNHSGSSGGSSTTDGSSTGSSASSSGGDNGSTPPATTPVTPAPAPDPPAPPVPADPGAAHVAPAAGQAHSG